MSDSASGLRLDLAPWPQVDHAAFGEIETVPLSRIQKLTGSFLARNWVAIPHVTHHDAVDITALEACRKRVGAETNTKLTALPFVMKAMARLLAKYPKFNASLDADGKTLVMKKYFHIGMAVDTPQGLLVGVVRDCDKKAVATIAADAAALSQRAREKGLPMTDMVGGCMTVSSLGHIGGTAFTPIVNAPEVAILGLTKAQWQPTRGEHDELVWRLMLPLSLSYDHRVINGVDAARFTADLGALLASPDALLE